MRWWHVFGAMVSELGRWVFETVDDSTPPDEVDGLLLSTKGEQLNYLTSFDHKPSDDEMDELIQAVDP